MVVFNDIRSLPKTPIDIWRRFDYKECNDPNDIHRPVTYSRPPQGAVVVVGCLMDVLVLLSVSKKSGVLNTALFGSWSCVRRSGISRLFACD